MAVTALMRVQHFQCLRKLADWIEREFGFLVSLGEGYVGDTAAHVRKYAPDGTKLDLDPTCHREDGGHLKGIAQDINVFAWNATGTKLEYLNAHPEHPVWPRIGQYWESLHPLARKIPGDANHLGFIDNGVI